MARINAEKLDHRKRIDHFMDVSEAVMREPLLSDPRLGHLGNKFTLVFEDGAGITLHLELPPRNDIERLLSALGKFMLGRNSDEVFLPKVLSSLYLCTDEEQHGLVKPLQKAARTFPTMKSLAVQGWPADDPPPPWTKPEFQPGMIWDREVAESWLFGDLRHSEPAERAKLQHLGDGALRQCGTIWVEHALIIIARCRVVIALLRERGEIHDPK